VNRFLTFNTFYSTVFRQNSFCGKPVVPCCQRDEWTDRSDEGTRHLS